MISTIFTIILTINLLTDIAFKSSVVGLVSISTEKLSWSLTNSDKSIFIANTEHEGVYTDLLKNGVLKEGDFYYRFNDIEYRWVSYDDWTYTTYIQIPESLLEEGRVVFEFDGLDTVAEIYINNEIVHQSFNMFTKHIIDVKKYLSEPPNDTKLTIVFKSPVKYAENYFLDYNETFGYEVVPECVPDDYHGECHANTIRKMQASFSWDWGPAFPNSGIWKPWRILGWSSVKISDVYFESSPITPLPVKKDPYLMASWIVYYKVFFDIASTDKVIDGTLRVSLDNTLYVNVLVLIDPSSGEDGGGSYTGYFIVPENTVETWWPNGYGNQPLYKFDVSFTPLNTPSSKDVSTKSVRVGFRTVKIDQSFVDESNPLLGRHFRAKINNVFLFLMGSNWIPAHVFPEQVTPEYTRQLLNDAKSTHQNCIRVWGGGIYETDEFYNIADELGILVWQDMMFACSMYPADDDFLNVTTKEVTTQVRRLQHHPSILLWATNNENEAALRGNWYRTKGNFDQYKDDYVKLYVEAIARTVKESDASREVVISSPSNGIESEEEGYVAQNPYDNHYGDVHFYNYVSNGWDWTIYPPTRFASEYGFQSFPSYQTLSTVFEPEDMAIDSELMNHRQHHPNGQLELKNQLKKHFDFIENFTPFQDYLYLLQLNQAIAVKTETEFYRRMRDTITTDGSGLTMGALYWQLNDIWQGASWSSIEYGGRWKILHYYVKKMFSPLIVVPWIENGMLKVTLVNDSPMDIVSDEKLELNLRLQIINSPNALSILPPASSKPFILKEFIPSQSANLIYEVKLDDIDSFEENCGNISISKKENYDNCFVVVKLTNSSDNSPATPENFLLLGEPKNALLAQVNFEVNVEQESSDVIIITLNADRIAMFVFLETPFEGTFSDNGFILHWNETSQIKFYGRNHVHIDEFYQHLKVNYVSNSNFVNPY